MNPLLLPLPILLLSSAATGERMGRNGKLGGARSARVEARSHSVREKEERVEDGNGTISSVPSTGSEATSPPIPGTRSITSVPGALSGNLAPGTPDCHVCNFRGIFQRLREARCVIFPGMSIASSRLRPKTLTQSHPNRSSNPKRTPLTRGRRWKVNQAFHSRPPAIQWGNVGSRDKPDTTPPPVRSAFLLLSRGARKCALTMTASLPRRGDPPRVASGRRPGGRATSRFPCGR